MARTKRSRRSYSAGEWGRNRVRVFADPKTGLYQIEWRENGRRLTRSLKHRDWGRAKRQADEAAAGFAVHEPNGKAEAESAPLTLERLFEIYGEEVVPAKHRRTRHQNRTAMRMFSGFPRARPKTRDAVAARLGPVHPGAARGQGRTERQARIPPHRRIRPEAPARDPQLGHQVEGRGGKAPPRIQSPPGTQGAEGEEPNPGRSFRPRIRGAAEGVPPSGLALPRRARARARDRTPHRCHPQAPLDGHRLRGTDHPLAR